MNEKYNIKLILLLTLPLLIIIGCAGNGVKQPPATGSTIDKDSARARMLEADQKVIILGVDGLTWRKLDAYRRQGLLPNFDKLIKSGASGKIESLNPMFSISLWTTIVTGVDYETHGVQYFYKFGNNGTMLPYTNLDRKVKALWNIMNDLDEPSGWVSWWGSWPAEPVKGFNISNYFIADFGFRDVEELSLYYPPEIGEDLQKIKDTYTSEWGETRLDPIIGDLSKINRENLKQDFWGEFKYGSLNWVYRYNKYSFLYNFLRNDFKNDALAMNAGLQMMDKYAPRLTGIYLNGIDGVSHKFWKYDSVDRAIPPDVELSKEEEDMFGRVLSEYYRYQDELLGQLLDKIDDKTTLMIVSDHGFQYVDKSNYISLSPLLHKLGYISFKDDGEKTDLQISLVHEVTIKPWDQARFIRINKKSNDFKDIDGTPLGAVMAGKEESELRQKLIGVLAGLQLKNKKIPLFTDVRKPFPQEINQNDGQGDILAQLNREIF
ncbi:MAG: alkaline phosphatase family protein, partial [bacterium]